MTISNKERLRRFFTVFAGEDHVLIPINADPDAIASAMAIKRLLWRKTASVTISNINKIERPDNLAMIRLIGVNMIAFETIDLERFNRIVMVDSQPDHNVLFKELKPDVIIDHHPIGETNQASFSDIRPKYGATASMLVEYIRAADIKPSDKLATGLYYAIKIDTSNFEQKTVMEDLNAFQFVFKHCNIALARRIESAEMRLEFLKFFKRALDERLIRKGRAFAHLGNIVNPDICVQIADFFMRIESINWSIITGIYQGKFIIILRNDGTRKDAGKIAKLAFGKLGSAGGHKSAARAEIPIEPLEQITKVMDRMKILLWLVQHIELFLDNNKNNNKK
ncbi:MAG: phosphoesterase [Desulfobacteraceae bacterium]|nr:phosphoesterase [Desulfobacteraceae bacterium]